jgi:hypothetical protein
MKKSIDIIRKNIQEIYENEGKVPSPGNVTVQMKVNDQVSVPEYLVKREVDFFKEVKDIKIDKNE